jgi:hypothetical protein
MFTFRPSDLFDLLDPFSSGESPEAPAPSPHARRNVLRPGPSADLTPDPVAAAALGSHWVEGSSGGASSLLYLGVNEESRAGEARALARVPGAHTIVGNDKHGMNGSLVEDGEVYDLANEEHVLQYLIDHGVLDVRVDADGLPLETPLDAQRRLWALHGVIAGSGEEGGIDVGYRDEVAQMVALLNDAETGKIAPIERVVLSGHSYGEALFGDAAGELPFADIAAVMKEFPQTQAGVQDLMLSACHTLEPKTNPDGEIYREMFPNLDTVVGYDGFSPTAKQGSLGQILKWVRAGGDPEAIAEATADMRDSPAGRFAKLIDFEQE